MFAPSSGRRNFFKCAPPNLKSWIRPCIYPIHDCFHFISFYIVLLDILIVLSTVFLVFKNVVPPFYTVCSRISSMTESKIRKRIFDINLGPVRYKTRKKSAILLRQQRKVHVRTNLNRILPGLPNCIQT